MKIGIKTQQYSASFRVRAWNEVMLLCPFFAHEVDFFAALLLCHLADTALFMRDVVSLLSRNGFKIIIQFIRYFSICSSLFRTLERFYHVDFTNFTS